MNYVFYNTTKKKKHFIILSQAKILLEILDDLQQEFDFYIKVNPHKNAMPYKNKQNTLLKQQILFIFLFFFCKGPLRRLSKHSSYCSLHLIQEEALSYSTTCSVLRIQCYTVKKSFCKILHQETYSSRTIISRVQHGLFFVVPF